MLVQVAKEQLDHAIQEFFSSKVAVVARIGESRHVIDKEQLQSSRHSFETALKNLNKYHTIWRCRYEEAYGCDMTNEKYSTP